MVNQYTPICGNCNLTFCNCSITNDFILPFVIVILVVVVSSSIGLKYNRKSNYLEIFRHTVDHVLFKRLRSGVHILLNLTTMLLVQHPVLWTRLIQITSISCSTLFPLSTLSKAFIGVRNDNFSASFSLIMCQVALILIFGKVLKNYKGCLATLHQNNFAICKIQVFKSLWIILFSCR